MRSPLGKLAGACAYAASTLLVPLVFVPDRMLHLSPWLAVGVAVALLVSQPSPEKARTLSRDSPDRWSALGIFVSLTAATLVAIVEFGYSDAAPPTMPLVFASMFLACAGLGLRLWAIRTLGRWFTANVAVVEEQPVVRSGPYAVLRHPSYTGAIICAVGIMCSLGSVCGLLALVALVVPAYLWRIKVEEKALTRKLGKSYEDYKRTTNALIPFIA
jgi:protein-S-isoprenylcysteine O-methyltransferase